MGIVSRLAIVLMGLELPRPLAAFTTRAIYKTKQQVPDTYTVRTKVRRSRVQAAKRDGAEEGEAELVPRL